MMQIKVFAITDTGSVRAHNEDNFAVCKNLDKGEWSFSREELVSVSAGGAVFVVADGMGGTNAGEVASDIAQQQVREYFEHKIKPKVTDGLKPAEAEKQLRSAIIAAHKAIAEHQQRHLETAGMGTTLIIGWLRNDSIHLAWAGDSRCYIYSPGLPLEPATDDHSLVWQLVQAGALTAEEARIHPESNIITQSLGDAKNPPKPSSVTFPVYESQRILLCSDGLNGMLSDAQLAEILSVQKPPADVCRLLTDAANEAGGEDNITCTLADVVKGKPLPPKPVPKSTQHETRKTDGIADQSLPEPKRLSQMGRLRELLKNRSIYIVPLAILLFVIINRTGGNGPENPEISSPAIYDSVSVYQEVDALRQQSANLAAADSLQHVWESLIRADSLLAGLSSNPDDALLEKEILLWINIAWSVLLHGDHVEAQRYADHAWELLEGQEDELPFLRDLLRKLLDEIAQAKEADIQPVEDDGNPAEDIREIQVPEEETEV